jgi:hypothetical protein
MSEKDLYDEEDVNNTSNEEDQQDEDLIINNNEIDNIESTSHPNNNELKLSNNNDSSKSSNSETLNLLLTTSPTTLPHTSNQLKCESNTNEINPSKSHTTTNPKSQDQNFNQALTNILADISKNQSLSNDALSQEVYDLLINDKNLIETELKKYSLTKKTDIASKIKTYLDIRNQKLKKLEQQANDEFNKHCTFTPTVNTVSSSTSTNISQIAQKKRNLTEFLQDQENYQKKVKDKMNAIKSNQDKQAIKELKLQPQICVASKKIAKEKNKSNEEVYKRLYKQHTKDNNKQQANQSNSSINNTKKHIVNKEKFDNLYNDAKLREQKIKEKENIEYKKLQQSQIYKPNINSNKYLFKKFKSQFKEQIEHILNTSNNVDKFTHEQIKTLFINLNFISNPNNNNTNAYGVRTQTQLDKEKQILNEIFSILKDDNTNLVKIDHVFIFCLSILNLLEYYIVTNYQENTNSSSNNNTDTSTKSDSHKHTNYNTNETNSSKIIDDEETQLSTSQRTLNSVKSNNQMNTKETNLHNNNELVHKINTDLLNRIVVHRKYGGFDCHGNYIISISQSKQLFKDYTQLYQNYNSFPRKELTQINTINQSNYRQSRVSTHNNNTPCNNHNHTHNQQHCTYTCMSAGNKKTSHSKSKSNAHNAIKAMNHIEQLYQESMKKKIQQEKEIEKHNQLKLNEELKLCTFKPKINPSSHYKPITSDTDNSISTEQRIEMLYKKGTEALLNKKDKTRNEIEIEKYHSECTFKPDIHDVNYDIFDKNKSIYQDDDLMKFHKRLKNGRDEKEYRDSAFERGEFLLRRPRNKSEGKSFIRKNDSSNMGGSFVNNSNVNQKSVGEGNTVIKKSREGERPLLEIDVNLKHGVKKKILVYDGDTAEELAEIFAEENSKFVIYNIYLIMFV